MKTHRIDFNLFVTLSLWGGLIAAGYVALLRYSFAPGQAGPAVEDISASLKISGARSMPQLVLSLHPHCPCSRATLKELAEILHQAPGAIDVTVLMYIPPEAPDSWAEGALRKECRRLHCRVQTDPGGKLAASVGSLTSGAVLLYDGTGRLRFQGGITASRGHEGDNAGRRTVSEILSGGANRFTSVPVFGCPIQKESAESLSL